MALNLELTIMYTELLYPTSSNISLSGMGVPCGTFDVLFQVALLTRPFFMPLIACGVTSR